MDWNLKDKVVVITGGADGIGLNIADRYLEKGAKVAVIVDIAEIDGLKAEKKLCAVYGSEKAVFMKCDVVKDLDAISKKIIDVYETVDVLVNNAGTFDELNCKKTTEINVQALISWSLKFWEHMRTDKGGKGGTIMNIASIYGYKINYFFPIYTASKFAVMGFTKSLGHTYHFNRSRVRVVAICPGYTYTKLIADLLTWDHDCLKEDVGKFVKQYLWQQPDSVGKAAVEVYEKCNSGTAWVIEGGLPIFEVGDNLSE